MIPVAFCQVVVVVVECREVISLKDQAEMKVETDVAIM